MVIGLAGFARCRAGGVVGRLRRCGAQDSGVSATVLPACRLRVWTPAIARADADGKDLAGSDFAVPIGKHLDRKAVLGMSGSHPPDMP